MFFPLANNLAYQCARTSSHPVVFLRNAALGYKFMIILIMIITMIIIIIINIMGW
jgi:hypothetical protein